MDRTYTLKSAAEQIGVSSVTLKRWLLREKVADVPRNRNGWRVFKTSDINRIKTYADKQQEPQDRRKEEKTSFGVASLFSGIGGFDLGFEKAGFTITFQCEINEFCLNILDKHWSAVPKATNIKELTNDHIPVSDVWVGGFPCQDVSLARMGKRDGLGGKQSGLFYEFARLVGAASPRVLVIENVPGLLSSHKGRDFGIVLRTLAEFGYSLGWRTLNSRHFGVPQSRQRVFIVGCYRDWEGPSRILFEPECGEGNSAKGGSNGEKAISPFKRSVGSSSGTGPVTQSIAYCLYACSARHTGTDWSRTYVSYPSRGAVRRLTPGECEGVMAFPKDWTAPTINRYKANDIDSLRYHALGNAVTPPVAEWLAGRIKAYLLDRKIR